MRPPVAEEVLHEPVTGREQIAGASCSTLSERDPGGLVFNAVGGEKSEWARICAVGPQPDGCRMVTHHSHAEIAVAADPVQDRPDHFFLEILYGLDLSIQIS